MTAIEFNHRIVSLYDQLKYFARTLTPNVEEAEDLVQDTYIKALSNREKFRNDINIKAWLFTIMKNTFINNYRRSQKAGTIIDNTDDLYYMNLSSSTRDFTPEAVMSEKEISRHISGLTDEHRVPFEMFNSGYKYKEIAEDLNISIGTVKSRIFFGRKKLMDKLKDFNN
jgi:RNA polymerase sigma-70 factor (ECF subfamily)